MSETNSIKNILVREISIRILGVVNESQVLSDSTIFISVDLLKSTTLRQLLDVKCGNYRLGSVKRTGCSTYILSFSELFDLEYHNDLHVWGDADYFGYDSIDEIIKQIEKDHWRESFEIVYGVGVVFGAEYYSELPRSQSFLTFDTPILCI